MSSNHSFQEINLRSRDLFYIFDTSIYLKFCSFLAQGWNSLYFFCFIRRKNVCQWTKQNNLFDSIYFSKQLNVFFTEWHFKAASVDCNHVNCLEMSIFSTNSSALSEWKMKKIVKHAGKLDILIIFALSQFKNSIRLLLFCILLL